MRIRDGPWLQLTAMCLKCANRCCSTDLPRSLWQYHPGTNSASLRTRMSVGSAFACWWDTLGKVENVGRVVDGLDALEPWQIRPVIGLLPVSQVRIDVVLVGEPAGIGAHRLPHIGQPPVVRLSNGSWVARVPGRRVLDGE